MNEEARENAWRRYDEMDFVTGELHEAHGHGFDAGRTFSAEDVERVARAYTGALLEALGLPGTEAAITKVLVSTSPIWPGVRAALAAIGTVDDGKP